jgi:hypothetical protein
LVSFSSVDHSKDGKMLFFRRSILISLATAAQIDRRQRELLVFSPTKVNS